MSTPRPDGRATHGMSGTVVGPARDVTLDDLQTPVPMNIVEIEATPSGDRETVKQLDQRALIMDGPLATFGDHAVPVWVDRILVPEQRTLTVRVERKR